LLLSILDKAFNLFGLIPRSSAAYYYCFNNTSTALLRGSLIKTFALLSLMALSSGSLLAQDFAKNVFFTEIGGPSFSYSVDY
jgi:hypothetical protein